MRFNIIDLFIVASLAFFSVSGYLQGFIRVTLDILTLVAAFFVAVDTYEYTAKIVEGYGIPADYSTIVGFLLVWAAAEVILYLLIQIFYPRIPKEVRESKANRLLGIIPAFIKGFAIISVLLLLLISFPFTDKIKTLAEESYLGKPITSKLGFLEGYIQNTFKDVLKKTEFTIIKPGSDEFIELGYTVSNGTVDEESEEKMLELLNKERVANGLKPLTMDTETQKVARKHSDDMFRKGYFAHKNREGKSPFDRLDDGGIKYLTAGENLALAPDVYIAHKGLMESPGHRENILTPEFKKVGIGVVDGGRYGKMFTQNFTD